MKRILKQSCFGVVILLISAVAVSCSSTAVTTATYDPLPSWNNGAAKQRGWVIISMKRDWNRIFRAGVK